MFKQVLKIKTLAVYEVLTEDLSLHPLPSNTTLKHCVCELFLVQNERLGSAGND